MSVEEDKQAEEQGNKLHELLEKYEEPLAAAFNCWVWLIHYLVHNGWTLEELTNDLEFHVKNELTWIEKERVGPRNIRNS
jgi:hypothetical protein